MSWKRNSARILKTAATIFSARGYPEQTPSGGRESNLEAVSYTVSQKTREFGVRMALGAQRAGVVRIVLQSSLVTVAAGAGIGLTLSLILGKLLATSSHATVRDPTMLLVSAGVLFATTALACLYPAWRAASIDPMEAIRTEQQGAP